MDSLPPHDRPFVGMTFMMLGESPRGFQWSRTREVVEILAGKSSPTVRTVARIAEALGVPIRDLFPAPEDQR